MFVCVFPGSPNLYGVVGQDVIFHCLRCCTQHFLSFNMALSGFFPLDFTLKTLKNCKIM